MSDPRIIAIALDEGTIPTRSAEVEREREVAAVDIIAGNRFAPRRPMERGMGGPYCVVLRVADGRLAIDIADADGRPAETVLLGLSRFRRTIREYFAIFDSYQQAVASGQAAQVETIDMARRGLHNAAAEQLKDGLEGKVDLDFDTARRLFTLIAALHFRG